MGSSKLLQVSLHTWLLFLSFQVFNLIFGTKRRNFILVHTLLQESNLTDRLHMLHCSFGGKFDWLWTLVKIKGSFLLARKLLGVPSFLKTFCRPLLFWLHKFGQLFNFRRILASLFEVAAPKTTRSINIGYEIKFLTWWSHLLNNSWQAQFTATAKTTCHIIVISCAILFKGVVNYRRVRIVV